MRMRRSARLALVWGVVLLLLGAALVEVLPELVWRYGTSQSWENQATARGISYAVTVVRSALFPLGAALIAAAVVIEAVLRELRPDTGAGGETDDATRPARP